MPTGPKFHSNPSNYINLRNYNRSKFKSCDCPKACPLLYFVKFSIAINFDSINAYMLSVL